MRNYFYFFLFFLLLGCDDTVLSEQNVRMEQVEWNYLENPSFEVVVTDTNATYATFVNIRFEASYNYSNLFFMFKIEMPDGTRRQERIECELFDDHGLPLGKGLGDLFFIRYKIPRITKFRQLGTYHIILEQNMRVDHLKGIHDLGIRVEKTNKE